MCGLAGFIDFKGDSDKDLLVNMTDALKHRGPDDFGYEHFQFNSTSIGLGFRRLAILDLSYAGHQPMKNPDTGDVIIFNGEIYNFKEIRKELSSEGFTFKSNGDTEVILAAYQRWGIACIERFIGMFAFVLYDNSQKKLYCVRDRAGVKPFFYYWHDNILLFASELKAFHSHPSFKKHIDNSALAFFFQHGYIASPNTIFQNTFQLDPGSYMELDLSGCTLRIEKYWEINKFFNRDELNISYDDVVGQTETLLISSFNYRMIADVPVGVFLSGGYDSTCVAALLQKTYPGKIKTYTIGFEEDNYNEAPHAKKVAQHIGSDHHEYYCSFRDAMNLIPKLPEIYDQPFGDSSGVPTTLISSIARKHVTVALSADGGDELFAGYPRHLKSLGYINKFNVLPGIAKKIISRVLPNNSGSLLVADRNEKLREVLRTQYESEMFDVINQTYTKSELRKLLNHSFNDILNPFNKSKELLSSVATLNKILAVDYATYLAGDILQKVDRASMSVSLEAREPFLDHRLVEFLSVVPSEYKLKGKFQKRILKDIVHKYVPPAIMDRPKMGFGIPLGDWCRKDLKGLFMDFMSDEVLKKNEYLNTKNIVELRDGYLEGKLQNFERIWFVFVFQMWLNKWM